ERLLVSVVRALGAAEVAVVLRKVLLVAEFDPLQLQVQLRRGRLGLGLAGGGILVGHEALLPSLCCGRWRSCPRADFCSRRGRWAVVWWGRGRPAVHEGHEVAYFYIPS